MIDSDNNNNMADDSEDENIGLMQWYVLQHDNVRIA